MSYGGGAGVAFQPGGDAGCEVGGVAGGQEQVGVVAAEAGEEVGGCLEETWSLVRGLRYGGEGLARGALLGRAGGGGVRGPDGLGGSLLGGGRVMGNRPLMRPRLGLRRRLRLRPGAVISVALGVTSGLVAGDRAGDDVAGGRALAGSAQVAVGFQLAQGGGDAVGALGKPLRETPDVDWGARGQRLDVGAQADREQ